MSWDIYEQMLKFNFQLRGELSEELKKATIITEIGIEVYSELINSLEGKEVREVATAEELLAILRKRYSPKKLLIAERHKMLVLQQEAGQPLAEFFSKIQQAASKCELTPETREMLVLQVFVKGIRHEGTRVHLLHRDKLTAAEALSQAQVMQMAENEGHSMGSGQTFGVHKVAAQRDAKCYECGKKGHFKANCPEVECRKVWQERSHGK
ncbi:hypothetical protein AAVH_13614 [Aphelenchoides avenae]|nr:hypothetical protein AAVH_13614 [Aphelenchus avenae]